MLMYFCVVKTERLQMPLVDLELYTFSSTRDQFFFRFCVIFCPPSFVFVPPSNWDSMITTLSSSNVLKIYRNQITFDVDLINHTITTTMHAK